MYHMNSKTRETIEENQDEDELTVIGMCMLISVLHGNAAVITIAAYFFSD